MNLEGFWKKTFNNLDENVRFFRSSSIRNLFEVTNAISIPEKKPDISKEKKMV